MLPWPEPPASPRRPRPRVWAVVSLLGAIAVTALWVVAAVRLFDEDTFITEGIGLFWMVHAAFVVVGGWFLWHWWRELLHPDVHREPPPDLDGPSGRHRGLSGEQEPPARW